MQMSKPKQGYLQQKDNEWTFIVGRGKKGGTIDSPKFDLLLTSMILNKKLFRGWKNTSNVVAARQARSTSNLIAHLIVSRKVSAANLHQLEAPTLLSHYKLHPDDKKTWDASYAEEYNSLVDIDTWETITEEEYENCKHILGKVMVIRSHMFPFIIMKEKLAI